MNKSYIVAICALVFCLFVSILLQGCLNTPPASSKEQKTNLSSESHATTRTGRFRLIDSGYAFDIEHGEATIADYKGQSDFLTVPQEIQGVPVTTIGDGAFYGCQALVQVTIPDSVKNIDTYAFQYCSNLTNVATGNGVTNVAACAFYGCENLSAIIFGERVASIGYQAFAYCSSLRSVALPDNVAQVGKSAFFDCRNIASLTIGKGIRNIPDHAFGRCSKLTSIFIPANVTNIESLAFVSCIGLTNVVLGSAQPNIDRLAFSGCDKLPDGVIQKVTQKTIVGRTADGKIDPFAHLRKNAVRDVK